MSKYVKNLITKELSQRLAGVHDALLVNVVGMDANKSVVLRKELRQKNISLLVVKNSLARRATEGTPLSAAFQSLEGSSAVIWGAEDFVSLVKEITELDKGGQYAGFEPRGGVMEGERLTPDRVKEISKWPNRGQQLSILLGQILSPGARLASQLIAPGGALASQIEEKSKGEDGEEASRDGEASPESASSEAPRETEEATAPPAAEEAQSPASQGEAPPAGE